MGNIVKIEPILDAHFENQPHEVAELMCLGCYRRWTGVYPVKSLLRDMECRCGRVGSIIKTGQTLETQESE